MIIQIIFLIIISTQKDRLLVIDRAILNEYPQLTVL